MKGQNSKVKYQKFKSDKLWLKSLEQIIKSLFQIDTEFF